MAEVFKNVMVEATTTETEIYTVPAATTAILMSLRASDKDGTDTTVTAKFTNADATPVDYFISNAINVPANAAVGLLDGKHVLEASFKVKVQASANAGLDIVLAILEIT